MEHLEHRELLSVSGSVTGSVYYDLDQSGTRDAAEVGVQDWTVEIQKIGDQELGALLDTIENPSLRQNRRFATSVAAYEDASNATHLFVASPNSEPAMILWYDSSGNLQDTIIDPVPGGSFGSSLAVMGDTLLVGDPDETVVDPGDPGVEYLQAGAVYAFDLTDDGSLDTTYYRRNASDQDAPAEGDLFGFSLAALTGGFVVGAPGDDLSGTDGGAAYRFDFATGDCEAIYQVSGLTGAALGTSIAADGTQVLIGAPDAEVSDQIVGKAFLFNLAGGAPTQEWTGPNLSDFGRSVALLGDNAYVGAPLEQLTSDLAGKVHVYNRASGAQQTGIQRPGRLTGDPGDFGRAMAVEGTNLFVSDPYNDAVFRFAGGAQTPNVEYTNPRDESAEFGYALTAHDGHPFVGDPSATYNPRAPGAAYRYEAPGSTATVLKSLSTIYNPTPVISEDPFTSVAVLTTDIFVLGNGADDSGGERSGCVTIYETGNPPITITEPPTGLGPQAEAMFGYCVVKVDSDHFLASAPGLNVDGVESVGEAYLFDTDGNLIQTFKNPYPEAGDRFGGAIRVSGNYALINCWPDSDLSSIGDDPNNSGAVCMFEIDTDPAGPDDAVYVGSFMTFKNHFGNSVAALGDNLLVGVPDSDSGGVIDTGSVYLMSPDTAWPILTLTAESTGMEAGDGDQFGFQVAAAGDNILVSAPGRAVDGTAAAGTVYLFDTDGYLLQVFENPTPEEGDGFGMSVAVVDDQVLIGAPYHDETGAVDTGAAYLFPLDATGSNRYPSPVATFLNPDVTDGDPNTDGTGDWFGWSVCGEDNDIVIGAPGDDDDVSSLENFGAAYRFEWNAQTYAWDESAVSYPEFASEDDYFGWSVSMLDDQFLVTARGEEDGMTPHAGKAFLFDREDPTTVQTLQPPSPQPAMGFGWSSVSVRDNRILVTAATLQQSLQPGDLDGDGIVNSADLDIIRANWGQYVTPGDLLAGDPSGDGFVGSADLDILRANWGASLPPAIAGRAYLFDAEDARLLRTFAEPASAAYGFFGMSAAVVGDEVLVSAPNASLVISEEGAVYRFDMGITLTETDSSGDYSFTQLEEGTYRVRQRPAEGYWQTAPSDPSTYTVDVTTSEYVFPGRNFGIALDWAVLTSDKSTDEGSPATLTVITDSDTPIESWQIDWGDGGGSVDVSAPASGFLPLDWGQGVVQVGNRRWEFTREGTAYTADDAAYTVEISANEGELPEGRFEFTVANVAPTITLTGDETVNKDVSYALTLADLVDPGQDAVQSYVVHWGDQLSDTYTAAQILAAGGVVTHTYAVEPGDVTISVDLVDEEGTYYAVAEKQLGVTRGLTWDPDGVTDWSFEGSGDWDDASAWLDIPGDTRYQWNSQWAAQPVTFAGGDETVNVNMDVTVEGMDFEGGDYTLSGTNTLTLTGGAISVDYATVEISAPLAGSAGLDKLGNGTLILSGTNTLTGDTTVTDGELRIDGSLASSPVTLLDLEGIISGTGTAGAVTVECGTLQPGGTAIGTLNTGDLTLSDRAALAMELGATARDLLDVTGTVDLGGAVLNLGGTRADLDSEVLVLIDNDGTDAVVGTFAGLREGATVECGGVLYLVTYRYDADTSTRDTGNDVALIDAVTLAAPSSVSASLKAGEYNEIDVSWTDTADETHFEIERNWNELGWEPVTTKGQNVTTHVDTGLQEFSSYRYRVRALDDQYPDKVSPWATFDLQYAVITGLSPTGDYDNDGLSNADEDTAGTDPVHFDTDGDGLPDGWEVDNSLDPMDEDSDDDYILDGEDDDGDSDGLTNAEEYMWDTNPSAVDDDGDGTWDGAEVAQGTDPKDAFDGVLGPPEDMITPFTILVGDGQMPQGHAPSEWWAMNIGDVRCVAPDYGAMYSGIRLFETGLTYPITLDHLGTDPAFLAYNGPPGMMSPWIPQGARYLPNYDWDAAVYDNGNETLSHLIDDPPSMAPAIGEELAHEYGLLDTDGDEEIYTHHWRVLGEPNLAEGKTAHLVVPQLDVDIDSLNDSGYAFPVEDNLAEDWLELDDEVGKHVLVNNGDIDGDGVVDYNDFDDGIEGGKFVPITFRLSENVQAAGLDSLDDVTLYFHYPDGYTRLWTKDAPAPRTKDDILPDGKGVALSKLGGIGVPITVFVEGLHATYVPMEIKVVADVVGTREQWTIDGGDPLEDWVHVEVLSVDIDTDSDNDGIVERDDNEEVLEDVNGSGVDQVGKRIFVNRDDDNQNGLPDVDDDSSNYGPTDIDNDFAEIKFGFGFDLNRFNGYQIQVRCMSGLDLYSSRKKERDSMPLLGDPGSDWYGWTIADGDIAMPKVDGVPTLYAEGTSTGEYKVLCKLLTPDGSRTIAWDQIEISVEKIVWPDNQNTAKDWQKHPTSNWKGFELEDAWWIEKTLCDLIKEPANKGEIRTMYPDVPSDGTNPPAALNEEGPDSYNTEDFSGGFTLTFDFCYENTDAFDGYVNADTNKDGTYQSPPDDHKMSFFANSGIKIWDIYEIQIFDTQQVLGLSGVNVNANTGNVSVPGYSPNEDARYLLTGVPYGGENLSGGDAEDNYVNIVDFDDQETNPYLDVLQKNALKFTNGWNTMKITFKRNGETGGSQSVPKYEVKTYLVSGENEILVYSNSSATHGTGNSGSGTLLSQPPSKRIRIQTHWDSGVRIKNVMLSDPPSN